jgi:hypothetical protein
VDKWLSKYGCGPLVREVRVVIFIPMVQKEQTIFYHNNGVTQQTGLKMLLEFKHVSCLSLFEHSV